MSLVIGVKMFQRTDEMPQITKTKSPTRKELLQKEIINISNKFQKVPSIAQQIDFEDRDEFDQEELDQKLKNMYKFKFKE